MEIFDAISELWYRTNALTIAQKTFHACHYHHHRHHRRRQRSMPLSAPTQYKTQGSRGTSVPTHKRTHSHTRSRSSHTPTCALLFVVYFIVTLDQKLMVTIFNKKNANHTSNGRWESFSLFSFSFRHCCRLSFMKWKRFQIRDLGSIAIS